MHTAVLDQNAAGVAKPHPAAPEAAPSVGPSPIRGLGRLVKDVIDRTGALSLIIFLLPVLLLVPLLIRLDSRGPVLFTQLRYGEGGRLFRIFKFRTLHVARADLAGAQQVSVGDTRVTRLGRFLRASSIDELPQLLNVLFGDMSLVGPRPHPLGMRTEGRLGPEITPRYMERYRVKPGMTGLAQIRGLRGPTATADLLVERITLDLEYIETWSIGQDLKILALTPISLLATSGPR